MNVNVFVRKYKTKNGETRYRLVVREFGKKEKYICLGPVSRKIAQKRRLQIMLEIQSGTYQSEPSVNLFFGEFLESYFFPWAKGERAPNTIQTYEEHLKPLRESFRGYRLSQIQRRDVETHFSEWKVSGRTKNIRLSVLRLVLTKAIDWKFLSKSPMEGIKRFPEYSQGSRALTPAELTRLWNGLTAWQKSLIRVMVNSGLRPGEVANLKFKDIDWDQNRLMVANDKTRRTKNRRTRFIPMNKDLREELTLLKEYLPLFGLPAKSEFGIKDYQARKPHQREFVFCNKDGTKVACIRRSLTRAFKKHGLQGVTPHGLRKTFCSQLARAKVHPKVAQTLMGHADISLTMRVYTEVDDDQLKEAVDQLATMNDQGNFKVNLVQGGSSS